MYMHVIPFPENESFTAGLRGLHVFPAKYLTWGGVGRGLERTGQETQAGLSLKGASECWLSDSRTWEPRKVPVTDMEIFEMDATEACKQAPEAEVLASLNWVAVKELTLAYHNGYIYIQ